MQNNLACRSRKQPHSNAFSLKWIFKLDNKYS